MSSHTFNKLKYISRIKLSPFPKQWIPKFELYYPDLPQFPIVYIHIVIGNIRIYGCPVAVSFDAGKKAECSAFVTFLCNVDLDKNKSQKLEIKRELEERFGISDKIGLQDIIAYCRGNKDYEKFFKDLWKYVSASFGNYIPFGRFYDEVYSIVRFVSAWSPKTGRQSEMRMLYNFLRAFGEEIEICPEWSHLEFYLLPTYDDLIIEDIHEFKEFSSLLVAIEKVWKIYYMQTTSCGGKTIRSMHKAWPPAKDAFINKVTLPLFRKGIISDDEKFLLERLVDAFNRHSWRAAFFIWSIMSARTLDYRSWDKQYFVDFYLAKKGKGISPKVVSCFVQQGFKKEENIPVDTWIETFHRGVLGIEDKEDFFQKFSCLGKLERIIWAVSQANKTNMKNFFDMLWCQRFGVTGNEELRMANPIACYECLLKKTCVGFKKIKNKKVYSIDIKKIDGGSGTILVDETLTKRAEKNECDFICVTYDKVPKKIYVRKGVKKVVWKLIDEFSGYLLKAHHKTDKINCTTTVRELILSLPEFHASKP